jgi:hypothetical protein
MHLALSCFTGLQGDFSAKELVLIYCQSPQIELIMSVNEKGLLIVECIGKKNIRTTESKIRIFNFHSIERTGQQN